MNQVEVSLCQILPVNVTVDGVEIVCRKTKQANKHTNKKQKQKQKTPPSTTKKHKRTKLKLVSALPDTRLDLLFVINEPFREVVRTASVAPFVKGWPNHGHLSHG